MTENSSIIKYFTEFKSFCNLDKADDCKGKFLLPLIGNCKRECKVVPPTLKPATPKKAYLASVFKKKSYSVYEITFT